ncbi:MAG TPA: phage holin family protein [Candidatus Paceibacterota bacterium]|nr:phage holin family protein [Candidatus Paceibacterota bacterium]
MKALIYILTTAVTLLLISQYVPGIYVDSFYTAVIVAIIWGILGLTVRPVLRILTFPINLLTFGLFSFILNALIFWFLATFIAGFHVYSFIAALEGSVILAIVAWAVRAVFKHEEKD